MNKHLWYKTDSAKENQKTAELHVLAARMSIGLSECLDDY